MKEKKKTQPWFKKPRTKKTFKIVKKFLGYFFTIFGSAILLYAICAFLLSRIGVAGKIDKNGPIEIYIMQSGVHTDFVLPARNHIKDWNLDFPIENTAFKDSTSTLLSVGWGDKEFYMNTPEWSDLTFKNAISIPFGIGPSAIHAIYYQKLPVDRLKVKLRLSERQYKKLVHYIENTLIYEDQKTKLLEPTMAGVVHGNDAFYAAKGSYNMFKTCNTWINNGLKECEQKASYWTPFPGGLFYQYDK